MTYRRIGQALFVGSAFFAAMLLGPKAWAQFDQMRAIERAIDINIEQALIRIPVSIATDEPPQPLQRIVSDEDGLYLLLLRGSNQFEVWNISLGRMERRGQLPDNAFTTAAIAKTGAVVFALADGRVAILEPKSNSPSLIGDRGTPAVTLMEWLPNGAGVVLRRNDGTVEVLETNSRRVRSRFAAAPGSIAAIAVDRTSGYAALADTNGTIGVWDVATGLNVASYQTGNMGPLIALFFPRASDRLIAVSSAGHIVAAGQRGIAATQACKETCVITAAELDRSKNELSLFTADNKLLKTNPDKPTRVSVTDVKAKAVRHASAAPSLSPSLLAVPLEDSTIELFRAADPTQPSLLLTSTENGWAVIDADGRFDGPSTIQDQLKWVGENLSVPLTNFSAQYFEPGLLRKWASAANNSAYMTKPVSISEGVALPPKLDLTAASARTTEGRDALQVTVSAEDQGGGLGNVLLYHQGVAVSPSRITTSSEAKATTSARATKRIEYRLQPVGGDNIVSVAAENADGVVSPYVERAVPVTRRIEKPTLHMLVVGINTYKVPRLNLEYARADAEKIAEIISKQASTLFSRVRITSLYDEKAERDSILRAISALDVAMPDDSVIIYLAGHGEVLDGEFNFLAHSIKFPFKAADAKQNGISFADLSDVLSRLDARKITLLLDTCKSGNALEGLDVAERDQRVLGIFGGRVGLHLLAATDKGQLATELSSLGHGIFTYSLLEALSGKADLQPTDGLISVKELVTYAEDSVARLSSQYSSLPQRPTAYSRGYDFAMSRK